MPASPAPELFPAAGSCGHGDQFAMGMGTSLKWGMGPVYYGHWDQFTMGMGTSGTVGVLL